MIHFQTPGVYYQRVDPGVGGITAIRTDVPGFVGIAERGPVDTPVPVQSWRQFQTQFGEVSGNAFLAYAVRGFFENGGSRCWIVRVANRDPLGGIATASLTLLGPDDAPIWRIRASSPGLWGNKVGIALTPRARGEAVIAAGKADANGATVSFVSGFARASLVRLSQAGFSAWRVLADVDPVDKRLLWVSADPRTALPYEAALSGFDPDRDMLAQSLEYSLAVSYLRRPAAVYDGLSLIPESEGYGPLLLPEPRYPTEIETGGNFPSAPPLVIIEELREPFDLELHPLRRAQLLQVHPLQNWLPLSITAGATVSLQGGADGLARLAAADFCGENALPRDSDAAKATKARGFRALDAVAEVAAVAIPDIHIRPKAVAPKAPPVVCVPDPCLPVTEAPPIQPLPVEPVDAPPVFTEDEVYRVQADLVAHCENRRDRIALLDPPYATVRSDDFGITAIRAWRQRFDSKYAALYFPWLKVADPLRSVSNPTRDIPPSGHVLGQYAAADLNVGVHKAPANSPLAWTQDITVAIDDERHGLLNHIGVNVIRTLPGRGIRILGARTLSSDPDWRYVNVRRLLLMIEKAIELSIQWAAFEPNDDITRNKIRLSILSFLIVLWQQGAFAGDQLEQALFVQCDDVNNPPAERNNGRLWVHIGVAPAKPFEFIVLRVGRIDNTFEIAGQSRWTGEQ